MNPIDTLEDMAGLAAAPWKLWLAGGGLLAALGAAGIALHHYGATRYAAGQAEVTARWNTERVRQQADALAASAANATETQRRLAAQQEAQDAHDQQVAAARRDAAAARTAADGLRRQLALYLDAAAPAGGGAGRDSAAAGHGAPGRDALALLADLLGRADGVAGELAAALDGARAAGAQCERAYDALTAQ